MQEKHVDGLDCDTSFSEARLGEVDRDVMTVGQFIIEMIDFK